MPSIMNSMERAMSIWKKSKSVLRSLKWIASKKGRSYLSEQKTDREGIEHCCDKHSEHKHKEGK